MSSPISYFKFVLAYCILPSKIICRVRSVHETGELTVWRSRCLMLPHKVWQRQIPSSCAVRQVIETVNSSKLSCEKTARKWMRGNNNFCYIARLSLNKYEHHDWLIHGHVPLIKLKCIPTGIQLRSCFPHAVSVCFCCMIVQGKV